MPDTTTQEYGQGWGQSPYITLVCPSGAKCLVKKMDPMDLLTANLFGTGDALGAMIQKKINELRNPALSPSAAEGKKKEIDGLFDRMQTGLNAALGGGSEVGGTIDRFLVAAVVTPALVLPPDNPEERKVGVFYTDTIGFPDKMYIFSKVMEGISALHRFPGDGGERVGALETVEDVSLPAE